jgi:hypothetical protein
VCGVGRVRGNGDLWGIWGLESWGRSLRLNLKEMGFLLGELLSRVGFR